MYDVPIGIVGTGMYLPEQVMTAAEIAEHSGLPEWVIREKFGIEQKHIPGEDDHPNQMALWAVEDCLARCGAKAEDIDLVICTTEEWREYLLWTSGIDLAHRIGAKGAWGVDIHMRCATTLAAMKMAKSLMQTEEEIETVLIAGGYRISDFINYKNRNTSFMWNIGSGAGAMLLKRNYPRNQILGTHLISDGSMSRDVIIPASGTMAFPTDQAVKDGQFMFDLVRPESMKARLGEVSMANWETCIDEALRKSSLTRTDIDLLNMILVKPSAYRDLLERVGLDENQGVYLGHIGHLGEQDSIISIIEAERAGKLKDGDVMLMIGAGIGYVWGAGVVRWGQKED